MKKTKRQDPGKKLVLAKDTVRLLLSPKQLDQVVGGGFQPLTPGSLNCDL